MCTTGISALVSLNSEYASSCLILKYMSVMHDPRNILVGKNHFQFMV